VVFDAVLVCSGSLFSTAQDVPGAVAENAVEEPAAQDGRGVESTITG
jgi:hypothetical protein